MKIQQLWSLLISLYLVDYQTMWTIPTCSFGPPARESGTNVNYNTNTDTKVNWVELDLKNLTVATGGAINADYLGYTGGTTSQTKNKCQCRTFASGWKG